MRVAVLGHVEWVRFLRVDRPVRPGVIVHACEEWEEPAGGGAVAAAELARLAGRCFFVTAVGDDERGRALPAAMARLGVDVRAPARSGASAGAVTAIDPAGERTIVVTGSRPIPRGDDGPIGPFDAAYFCKGDADLLAAARASSRVLVATARVLPVLRAAGVRLDALVHSADDPSEPYADGDLDPAPALVVTTEGAAGGRWRAAGGEAGRWAGTPLPGPLQDTYGAGDCFAAALTHALAAGRRPSEAVDLAAARGALALTRRGAHGGRQETG